MKGAKEMKEEVKAYTPKMAEYKKKVINELVELIKRYPVIGLVNMENLPTPQLQKLRSGLRDTVKIFMTKKRFMKIALENAKSQKKGVNELSKHFEGMPALIFTEQNPFKISSIFHKNKSSAPAKPNQLAPEDIVIPAGPTPFAPGPIISELGMAGIKSGVEGGKVVVKVDCVVAKKGERIKPKVADVLARLSIQPMEVGLELIAAYDNGIVYGREILSITQEEYLARIVKASSEANALSLEICYLTKETLTQLIVKAFVSASALAENQNIPTEKVEEGEVKREGEEKEKEKGEVKEEKEVEERKKYEVKEEKKEEKIEIKELKEELRIEEAEEVKEEEKLEEVEEEMKKPEEEKEMEEVKIEKEEKHISVEEKKEPKEEKIVKKPRMVADAVSLEKATELLEQLEKSGTFRKGVEKKGETEPKKVVDVDMSHQKIEELTKKLQKKGTLRDKGGK